jgi:SAM-dependent methyltransferase
MAIAKQGLTVYGIDPSIEYIKLFKSSLKKNLNCLPRVGLATELPYESNFFDAVVATEVFEHVKDPKKAIGEAYRVLRVGGRGCISVPTAISEKVFGFLHPYWKQDSGHVNLFTEKELSKLLSSTGFKIVKTEKRNFEWSLFWLIHSLLRTRFDDRGSPKENLQASEIYFRFWRYLERLKLAKIVLLIGNFLFPKSYYVYVEKDHE